MVDNPFKEYGVSDDELAEALTDRDITEAKVELADKAADYWRSVSPVGDESDDPHPGEYRDSIEVTVDGDEVKVGTDLEYAHIIEYGSEDTPEFAPRAKVEEHFG